MFGKYFDIRNEPLVTDVVHSDPCYRWVQSSQTCEMYCTVNPYIPSDCKSTYVPSTYGYSLNAATQCKNGLNLLPGPNAAPVQCPTVQPSGFGDPKITGERAAGDIIAIIFIVIGGTIFLIGVALAVVFFVRRKRRVAAPNAATPSGVKPRVSSNQEGAHNPYAVQLDESSM